MTLERLFDSVRIMAGRRDDGSVPVELHRVRHECRARWHRLGDQPWAQQWVSVGILDDGRWYLDVIAEITRPARVYPTKQQVWNVARGWMGDVGGTWERVPCYPTRSGAGAALPPT